VNDHDSSLEASVLRYVLAAPPSWRRLGELRPDDLAIPAHRDVLAAILDLGESGAMPASERVIEALRAKRQDEAVRTAVRLLQGDATPLAAVSGAVEHLRGLSRIRRLREPLLEAVALIDGGDVDACIQAVQSLAETATSNADATGYPWLRTTPDVVAAAMEDVFRKRDNRGLDLGAFTPLGDHMAPGNLIVIAGETNAGKSSLALWMALRWWAQYGARVGIVSVEDREAVWGRRMVAHQAKVDLSKPQLSRNDMDSVVSAADRLKIDDPIHYAILEDNDVSHVARYAKRLAQSCGLIVVDYLQEITDRTMERKGVSERERLTNAARACKRVAKVAKVPVILVSQLSRPENKKHREPTMFDIKGSGDVENMAEGIVLIWRDGDHEGADALAKVAKLKDSPKRPRVALIREDGGAITQLRPLDKKSDRADVFDEESGS